MKVLFLTNIPSPYRVDFFSELGKYCDLTVLYELDAASDRDENWKSEQRRGNYREIFLKPVIRQKSDAWCPSVKRFLGHQGNDAGRTKSTPVYDIIIVGVYSTLTGMTAICHMKRKRIPYVISCDGGFISAGEHVLKRKVKNYFLSGARAYLSTGKMCDEYLCYYGAERSRIYHYPFTSLHKSQITDSPLSKAEKQFLKKEMGLIEEKIILFVGSFFSGKGIDVLLKASAGFMGEYGIYCIGGEATEEYREIIEKYSIKNVHFLPFMKTDRLQEYYRAADVFAFPTRSDVWGLVVNEAMAAGLPVVTTDRCVAGLELIQNGRNGYIVSVDDVMSFRMSINKLLADDALRQDMSQSAVETIKDYTIENMAKAHYRIFEELVK